MIDGHWWKSNFNFIDQTEKKLTS